MWRLLCNDHPVRPLSGADDSLPVTLEHPVNSKSLGIPLVLAAILMPASAVADTDCAACIAAGGAWVVNGSTGFCYIELEPILTPPPEPIELEDPSTTDGGFFDVALTDSEAFTCTDSTGKEMSYTGAALSTSLGVDTIIAGSTLWSCESDGGKATKLGTSSQLDAALGQLGEAMETMEHSNYVVGAYQEEVAALNTKVSEAEENLKIADTKVSEAEENLKAAGAKIEALQAELEALYKECDAAAK